MWLKHDGTGLPRGLAHDVAVDVEWRNGMFLEGRAADFQWHWKDEPQAHDIIRYREQWNNIPKAVDALQALRKAIG